MASYAVVALLCLLAGTVCQICEGSTEGRGGSEYEGAYTNVWAVGVYGGRELADRVARRHGFQNHGQVNG